jgi:hypothetical protein
MRVPAEVEFVAVGIPKPESADIPLVRRLIDWFNPTLGDVGYDGVQIVEIHREHEMTDVFGVVNDIKRSTLSQIPDGSMIAIEKVGFPTQQTFVPIERPFERPNWNTDKELHMRQSALARPYNPASASGDCRSLQHLFVVCQRAKSTTRERCGHALWPERRRAMPVRVSRTTRCAAWAVISATS